MAIREAEKNVDVSKYITVPLKPAFTRDAQKIVTALENPDPVIDAYALFEALDRDVMGTGQPLIKPILDFINHRANKDGTLQPDEFGDEDRKQARLSLESPFKAQKELLQDKIPKEVFTLREHLALLAYGLANYYAHPTHKMESQQINDLALLQKNMALGIDDELEKFAELKNVIADQKTTTPARGRSKQAALAALDKYSEKFTEMKRLLMPEMKLSSTRLLKAPDYTPVIHAAEDVLKNPGPLTKAYTEFEKFHDNVFNGTAIKPITDYLNVLAKDSPVMAANARTIKKFLQQPFITDPSIPTATADMIAIKSPTDALVFMGRLLQSQAADMFEAPPQEIIDELNALRSEIITNCDKIKDGFDDNIGCKPLMEFIRQDMQATKDPGRQAIAQKAVKALESYMQGIASLQESLADEFVLLKALKPAEKKPQEGKNIAEYAYGTFPEFYTSAARNSARLFENPAKFNAACKQFQDFHQQLSANDILAPLWKIVDSVHKDDARRHLELAFMSHPEMESIAAAGKLDAMSVPSMARTIKDCMLYATKMMDLRYNGQLPDISPEQFAANINTTLQAAGTRAATLKERCEEIRTTLMLKIEDDNPDKKVGIHALNEYIKILGALQRNLDKPLVIAGTKIADEILSREHPADAMAQKLDAGASAAIDELAGTAWRPKNLAKMKADFEKAIGIAGAGARLEAFLSPYLNKGKLTGLAPECSLVHGKNSVVAKIHKLRHIRSELETLQNWFRGHGGENENLKIWLGKITPFLDSDDIQTMQLNVDGDISKWPSISRMITELTGPAVVPTELPAADDDQAPPPPNAISTGSHGTIGLVVAAAAAVPLAVANNGNHGASDSNGSVGGSTATTNGHTEELPATLVFNTTTQPQIPNGAGTTTNGIEITVPPLSNIQSQAPNIPAAPAYNGNGNSFRFNDTWDLSNMIAAYRVIQKFAADDSLPDDIKQQLAALVSSPTTQEKNGGPLYHLLNAAASQSLADSAANAVVTPHAVRRADPAVKALTEILIRHHNEDAAAPENLILAVDTLTRTITPVMSHIRVNNRGLPIKARWDAAEVEALSSTLGIEPISAETAASAPVVPTSHPGEVILSEQPKPINLRGNPSADDYMLSKAVFANDPSSNLAYAKQSIVNNLQAISGSIATATPEIARTVPEYADDFTGALGDVQSNIGLCSDIVSQSNMSPAFKTAARSYISSAKTTIEDMREMIEELLAEDKTSAPLTAALAQVNQIHQDIQNTEQRITLFEPGKTGHYVR